MLVVQAAPEVNELRYVLVPKRMGDAQFWQVYFALAEKLLPPVAFDPSFAPPASDEHRMTLHDLQVAPPPGTCTITSSPGPNTTAVMACHHR